MQGLLDIYNMSVKLKMTALTAIIEPEINNYYSKLYSKINYMRLFRPCFIAGWLYPEALFRVKTNEKILCLTFDDGPDPDSTPVLLDILDKYDVKAVFFCNGRCCRKISGSG